MSASRKVPATFGVWATYEEFQKGHIPDEVFGKDEYNLAVDYAQDLSVGRYPALIAINTTYRGKRNDFARMLAASRSEYDGAWRPYARVFMNFGVTEISDERARTNQRLRNKCAGITLREIPKVEEPEQFPLFDVVEDDEGGKYYPPVEMEMVDDLMGIGDNDQPDNPGTQPDTEGIAARVTDEVRRVMRDEMKYILADALRQAAYDIEAGIEVK